ncbi:MAG: PIG-L family deacetylase [Pseudomonadota bacterium]
MTLILKPAVAAIALVSAAMVQAQNADGEPSTTRAAPRTVLAILAHPDDELTVAPVLARVAREGGAVTLIYATSGDAGPGTSGLDRADDIATMRTKEGRCAARALGLGEPVFWELSDGALATMARAPGSAAKRAVTLTRDAIAAAKPDAVITWGPDGGYGHADHRMISAIVSQAVAGIDRERPELLYAAFVQGEGRGVPGFENWAVTASDLVTDTIAYSVADLDAAQAAMRCYESQFPLAARRGLMRALDGQVWRGAIPFRRAFSAPH